MARNARRNLVPDHRRIASGSPIAIGAIVPTTAQIRMCETPFQNAPSLASAT